MMAAQRSYHLQDLGFSQAGRLTSRVSWWPGLCAPLTPLAAPGELAKGLSEKGAASGLRALAELIGPLPQA